MPKRKAPPPPCPQADQHTPAPTGYLAWHEWAEEMAKTHEQKRCPGCGLFKIWVPKETPGDAETEHWGPDPAFGNLCKHVGPREECSGPDCGPDDTMAGEGSQ